MTLQRLKWLAILAPLLFLGGLELVRRVIAPEFTQTVPGFLLIGAIALAGILFFAEAIFTAISRAQERLAQQNQELLALHDAGLSIIGDLELDTVLQTVVDEARDLVGARYGALSYLRGDGEIAAFLTSGITSDERRRIGPIPAGHGLLGVVLSEGEHLRLADLSQDPRSVGFPPHHPEMHALLAVPIRSQDAILGNLYVTDKEEDAQFSAADEETLDRFATQAALAIQNARLHQQVQALAIAEERGRIAREMHDSLAQVLAYVNTKAQAVQVLLDRGETDRASVQVGQMAESAREAYADVREGILALRTAASVDQQDLIGTLAAYLERWEEQSGIRTELETPDLDGSPGLTELAEVHLLRLIQEALTNIRKHAQASHVHILIEREGSFVHVEIRDDGIGFAPDELGPRRVPRFGLSTMRERAEASGGTFVIESRPGSGTTINVRLPVDPA